MSQCIGVGCWVLTTDKKVVFVENAAWKGEQACRVDRPGGHAEPGECAGEDATKLSGAEVRRELFHCIQRELRDEVNIGLEHQTAPELLGVVYNHERGGRLSENNIIISKSSLSTICLFSALDFLIECDVDSETVRTLYNQGGSETDESTDLFFVDVEAITGDKLEQSFVSRFTPHCAGSIHLLIHRLDQSL